MTSQTGTHDMREAPGGMFPGHAAPARELALIRRMMEQAQEAAALDGRHLVLWGVLLAAVQAVQLALRLADAGAAGAYPWVGAMVAGICGSAALGFSGRRHPTNLAVRLYGSVWTGLCLTIVLLFVLALAGRGIELAHLGVVASATTGLAFFVSAAIAGLGWLRWIALAWWAAAPTAGLLPAGPLTNAVGIALYLGLMALPGLAITRRGTRA